MTSRGDDMNALVDSEYSSSQDQSRHHYVGSAFCNPSSRVHRYFVLIFMSMLAFGSYYCYDNPSALEKHIVDDMGVDEAAYANLYSWYSYPNVVLCFFGGFLLDAVFGIRMGAVIFAAFICLGQAVFASGALINQFWLMVLGRFIFGIGGESLAVAQNTYAVLWFKGKELNTVFGMQLSIARLGSMANFNSIIYVYDYVSKQFQGHTALGITLMLACSLCVLSLISSIIMAMFDKRAERILNRDSNSSNERVNIKDVLYFPADFWLLCAVCVSYYVALFPFISYGGVYIQKKFHVDEKSALILLGIPYTVSAIASPFCGLLCDLTGSNLIWTLLATIGSTACHLSFIFLPVGAVPPMVIMIFFGLWFSLMACAFWPMVALIIPEHQLGTAYGVMQAIQNLGLAVVAQIAGMIAKKYEHNPDAIEYFFLGWASLAIVFCALLQIYNTNTNGSLNPYPRAVGSGDDAEILVNAD